MKGETALAITAIVCLTVIAIFRADCNVLPLLVGAIAAAAGLSIPTTYYLRKKKL